MKAAGHLKVALGLFALSTGAIAQSAAAGHSVFQLGQFDRSSSDFHGGQPSAPVLVDASLPNAANQWFSIQPAVPERPASTKPAEAPRSIKFSLDGRPEVAYRLRLALILESRCLPHLLVTINGKPGRFFLDSQLDAKLGTMDDSFQTRLAPVDVAIDFPGTFLRPGPNTIGIQVLQDGPPTGLPEDLYYDAIALDSLPAQSESQSSTASIVPTIFYKDHDGVLSEQVNIYLRHTTPSHAADSVHFTLAGKTYDHSLDPSTGFGEDRCVFWVPSFAPHTATHLAWTDGSQPHNLDLPLDPSKKWTVYLVPQIHLDIGYSDYQPKVAAIQSRVLDEAIDFAHQHPGFRFSTDGFWNVEQFWATRSPADRERLVTAIRNGDLSIPAEYANILTGFPTGETLIRSLYPSANFSREHSTPFNYADITDVPSYGWSYASVLASAGVPYFIAGPNGRETRAPVLLQGRLDEHSPFWWVGPDGKKVLFWYSRHYQEMEVFFGRPPIVAAAYQMLPIVLGPYQNKDYAPSSALMFGSQQENTDLAPGQTTFAADWNAQYAYPHLEYAGFHEALQHIADQAGSAIPSYSGDGGPYWEDGIAADTVLAASERANESRGPAAEQLATISTVVSPLLAVDKPNLDRMWRSMLLVDEHTFTSHNANSDPASDESVRQTAYKHEYATEGSTIADYVARESMASITDAIPVGRGGLVVFNTLNWTRTGPVLFDLNHGEQIVDSVTGQVVPVETLADEQNLSQVRFFAHDVPADGYKVFTLQRGTKPSLTPSASSTVIDSRFYKVTLDPASGSILSIFDKEQQRELVDPSSPYRFGQYLYVTGGDSRNNSLLHYSLVPHPPALQVTGAHHGRLISTERVSNGWVAHLESEDVNTPKIETTIRIFDEQKKIEITEDIDKQYVRTREAVYIAFPFAMEHPQFQYEVQNGVVDPTKDMLPGAGHEWFSQQHWVSVQQNGLSATVLPLDAGLVTLGDIYRGLWPSEFGDRKGSIFSFAMNNYWSTNYLAGQGGHFRLRYVVTSARSTDAAALSRLGWEESTSLEANEITSQDKAVTRPSSLDAKQESFLHVDDPALLLQAWKRAEDSRGSIIRFLDLGGSARSVTVDAPLLDLAHVTLTDAVERDQLPLTLKDSHHFTFTIHPHEILTLRLESAAAKP